jgi:hypothetical protein
MLQSLFRLSDEVHKRLTVTSQELRLLSRTCLVATTFPLFFQQTCNLFYVFLYSYINQSFCTFAYVISVM